ncbi:MAG TPA: acyltransferase [Polyangiaceae bacterium]
MVNSSSVVAPVQALRAVAAWLVVYHHYVQVFYDFKHPGRVARLFASFGNFGVDIFFVVSGFVMYYALHTRNRSAGVFFVERVVRIVPNYWFYTFLLVPLWPLHSLPTWPTGWTASSLIPSLFFIPVENPATHTTFPLLKVGWTLNYEMFFYATLAVCLFLVRRYAFVVVSALLALLPVVWPKDWPGAYLLSSEMLPEFGLGIALGALYVRKLRGLRKSDVLGLLLIALAFVALVYLRFPLKRMFCAGTIVLGALLVSSRLLDNAVGRFVQYLGDTSYSTYLSHTIILTALLYVWQRLALPVSDLACVPLVTVLVFLVSGWSYRVIEQGSGKRVAGILAARLLPGYAR